jgi:L-amino acid N-acyltransferase YncA
VLSSPNDSHNRERVSASLRIATESDGAAVARIYSPAVTERSTSFEIDPPDAVEMSRRIGKILPRFPWLVCEIDDEVVGYAYAGAHHERAAYRWSVDVATYIDARAHRCGIGLGLYTALFDILVLQGFRNACAGITLPNAGSEGLHRAFGFSLVGVYHRVGYKFGEWHDVGWFERELAPRRLDPPEPIPFAAVRDRVEIGSALRKGESLIRPLQGVQS